MSNGGAAGSGILATGDLLVLLNHALTGIRRCTGLAAGLFFALAVFAGCSVFWASDHYAAAVGGQRHLLAAAALLWGMAQVVHDWQSVSALAGTCLGVLLCLLAQGIYYQTVDLPDLRDRWVNDVGGTRTKLLQQHNWAADSFAAKQFGLKITHGDLGTFFTSANTYAAMLALLALVVAGMVLSDVRKRTNIALLLLSIPFFWLLWLTQCKAAFVTLALGVGLFLLLRSAGPMVGRFRPIHLFSMHRGLFGRLGIDHWLWSSSRESAQRQSQFPLAILGRLGATFP